MNVIDCLRDEIKIIEYESKSVKVMNYENMPTGSRINGDDRIANLIFKKRVKIDAYKLTTAQVKHIDKALSRLEQNSESDCIDAILLRYVYLNEYRSE